MLSNLNLHLLIIPGIYLLLLVVPPQAMASEVAYVNWENHPVHALDISPDKSRLAVTHTADNRVQLFDVSLGYPVRMGHVKVGVDPVSVRFRNNNELWVVNHISDSISVVDFNARRVVKTIPTGDEPFDVVFANERAFVSCSQVNQVWVFNPADPEEAVMIIDVMAEDPRAMTVNTDGSRVYVASFESGNRTTILGGGIDETENTLPSINPVNRQASPYGGQNPPPNDGNQFFPAIDPELPTPPKVSLIVKQQPDGRWLDDNGEDWTHMISGPQAGLSGRVPGWELLDHDISVINTDTFEVSYVSGLMNLGMAIGYNSATAQITLVGTDATNEVRFEPVLKGVFLRVNLGVVDENNPHQPMVVDLNPHLDYQAGTIAQESRDQSLGDPRGVIWQDDGSRGYVSGMGSNNVIVINANGERQGIIEVGEGATGLGLDESQQRLYVWNHFAATLSVIDTSTQQQVSVTDVFNPLPESIKNGRRFLYDTHETSGLGHIACASCHVDGRMDRLAWDLGDPAGEMKSFNQNCQTTVALLNTPGCDDFHPMKGPMMTQTFQDIIGHEPFHWRGDRDGLEEFNAAFIGLNGDDQALNGSQMQQFEDMLDTITFPPNPFRKIDNTLPQSIDLTNHYTSGRFSPAGQPLGTGNPVNGLALYNSGLLDSVFQCASCHTLPTGMAVNGALKPGILNLDVGGSIMPIGPMGENHLGVVSVDGSTQKSIKTPQLRNLYDKVGFETSRAQSLAGFGFLHDGAVDSVARFLSAGAFSVASDQEVADLVALMMAFSGSELNTGFVPLGNTAPVSQDSHAGVGQQYTLTQASQVDARVSELLQVADSGKVDLVARSGHGNDYLYKPSVQQFADSLDNRLSPLGLMALVTNENPITYTLLPSGLGERLAFDRDGDGVYDDQEIIDGSDPTDALSAGIKPTAGLWFNPQRSGHGMDIQMAGNRLFMTWYTYNDDGTPTWYLAANEYSPDWQADLVSFTWDEQTRSTQFDVVGSVHLDFSTAQQATFSWDIGGRTGTEDFQYFIFGAPDTVNQWTGSYYDASDSGWGITVGTQGSAIVSIIYYFNENGAPVWAIGAGQNDQVTSLDMYTNRGFCPDCAYQEPTFELAGVQGLVFLNERNIQFDVTLQSPTLPINWNTTNATLTPLSNPFFDPARQ
ncbi:YncE family protein [Marinicella sediminis]|uniref:YncE family protein n=2 Tax=Marinicella sediminis TaxID=1792834 RepID=A0ABV7JHV5_9GAMM|nr:hypothetical protein [Marinicella sediminis]